jgi:hypothetical protein
MQRIIALWNRSLFGKAIIGLAGLVIVCCVIGVLVPRQPQTAAPAAPAAQAPSAAVPRATAVPSATTGPTDTPQPSRTPRPTAEPSPTTVRADVSVKAYMATVAPITGQIGTALGRIGELFKAPDLTSDSWKIDVAAQLVTIQMADAQLRAMKEVPEAMQDIHQAMLDGTADCKKSTELVTSGIDHSSIADLNRASTLMVSCGTKLSAVAKQVRANNDAHP